MTHSLKKGDLDSLRYKRIKRFIDGEFLVHKDNTLEKSAIYILDI